MALTFRTKLSETYSSFTSVEQSLISATAVNTYRKLETDNFELFNYALKPQAEEKLSGAGIYFSPHSGMPHSHPVCKTLENYFLYKVLPSYLNNSFFFIGVKNHKLEFLKKRQKNLGMVELINRYVTSKDKLRYGSEFVRSVAKDVCLNENKFNDFDSASLRDLLPEVIKSEARHLFMHDELHYWSKDDLITFLEAARPQTLIGTLVYPPELLIGATESLNKWCYTFDVIGKNLHFFPDGVRSEGYLQPVSGGFLLRTGKIRLSDGTIYCVDLIHSKFAHHLVSITLGDAIVDTKRSFGNFEAISACKLGSVCKSAADILPISSDIICKIYMYLRTLQKPDVQSAMAKLRQLVMSPTGFQAKFIKEFAQYVIDTKDSNSVILSEGIKQLKAKFAKKLPDFINVRFSCVKEINLDEFMSGLEELHFTIDTHEIDRDFNFKMVLTRFFGEEGAVVEVPDISSVFNGTIRSDFRLRGQYRLKNADLINQGKSAFEFDEEGLFSSTLKFCVRLGMVTDYNGFDEGYAIETLKKSVEKSPFDFCFYFIYGPKFRIKLRYRAGLRERHVLKVYANIHGLRAWFKVTAGRRGLVQYLTNFSVKSHLDGPLRPVMEELLKVGRSLLSMHIDDVKDFYKIKACRHKTIFAKQSSVLEEFDYMDESADSEDFDYESLTPSLERLLEKKEHDFIPKVDEMAPEEIFCTCGIAFAEGRFTSKELVPMIFPDRLKNRSCAWYSEQGLDYKYNGGMHKSLGWGEWCKEVLQICGMEHEGYNSVLVQKYDKEASIGFHSDDEPIFVKGSAILTINLIGLCLFDIRGKKQGSCGGSFLFEQGAFFVMPKGFQETHKHSISMCSEGRVSLTFRQTAKNPMGFEKNAADSEDECTHEELFGTIITGSDGNKIDNFKIVDVKADGDCFWSSVGYHMGLNGTELKKIVREKAMKNYPGESELNEQMVGSTFAERESIAFFCSVYSVRLDIHYPELNLVVHFTPPSSNDFFSVLLRNVHYQALIPKNDCVVVAISQALNRKVNDVHRVLARLENKEIFDELMSGLGLSPLLVCELMNLFGIRAIVHWDGEHFLLNEGGKIEANFEIENEHMSFVSNKSLNGVKLTKEASVATYNSGSLISLKKSGTPISYDVEVERAKLLASSLYEGTTGSISSKLFNGAKNYCELLPEEGYVKEVFCILGTFGSGKSTLFKNFFGKNVGKHITFVSPRRGLADDFSNAIFGGASTKEKGKKRDARSRNWHVFTFEQFLKKASNLQHGQVLILDEIQLYPPGYLDLALFLVPSDIIIFAVGDPCQSDYDSSKDRLIFNGVQSDIMKLLEGNKYSFNVKSKRFKNKIFVNRLPCEIQENDLMINQAYVMCDSFAEVDELGPGFNSIFLVSSFEEKRIVNAHYGDAAQCYTFGESTGRTFQVGTIIITGKASSVSERRWVTALSRFSTNLCFLNLLGIPFQQIPHIYDGRFLAKFLYGKSELCDLMSLLPGEPEFSGGFGSRIGKDFGVREDKLRGDPWLKGMIELMQEEDAQVEEIQEELNQIGFFKTHLPRCDLESIRSAWVDKILLKEARERWIKGVRTEQFPEDHSKNNGRALSNAAERYAAIYPRHRNNDTATFLMAVRKRLTFSTPAAEMAKLRDATPFGEAMLKLFLKHVPLKAQHNSAFMEKAKKDFFDKKVSKSGATIENHSGRSCRDWLLDSGLVFIKSQHCTKFEKRFCEAKAAQSIVCFQHEVLCRFAPYMRYIEMKLFEVLPKNFYVHSGKGLPELEAWVKVNNFSGVCTESDYEAFDASQDEFVMAFEISVMKYLGLPCELINDYIFIKTHLGSKLGNFAIMRFSGEASTFLFNTMANMLFTFMRYDISGKESICFAGDDMCASRRLRLSEEYCEFLEKLHLKAKVCFTDRPTFCGWNLSTIGIFKKPQLVLERMCIAIEENNLQNCIDNYAIEVSYAYCKGEEATVRMSEEELMNHYLCVRTVIKNKHLLKSDVKDLFANSSSN
ncbi:replicase [Rose virus B]|uniref:Replicase n=1 Tax=Rose virus B TaxID=2777710 RepID=A0A7L9QI35_9VIRU|nr:replicase [Rose virus B]QOL02530.1 replicase [Rose virus B]